MVLKTCKKFNDIAKQAGANAVKFQTFKTEKLIIPKDQKPSIMFNRF